MLSYQERVKFTNNKTAKKLLSLMDEKKTNLSVAVDVIDKNELLNLADLLGPEICVLKTHIDIIENFDTQLIRDLQRLSEKHNFLIFEDRKFADIGNTVMHQYQDGIYHISDWSHITNAHTVAGPGTIEGLKKIGLHKGNGLLILAEMSPQGNLAKGEYTSSSIKMAENNKDFVIGFITMRKLSDNPGFINITPGVKLEKGIDSMGQQYNTPELVIFEKENDIIIVGRGIIKANTPLAEAKKYREAGWKAYQKRLKKEVSI